MSTRSRIGVLRTPESVESVYCHFDGYPEGVGRVLLDHWTDPKKVNALIALGDLSALGEEIGEDQGTKWFDERWETIGRTPEDPRYVWTVAYTRDRGETDCKSVTHAIDDWPDYGQEMIYLFDPENREWSCQSDTKNPVGWNTVKQWEGWLTIPEAIKETAAA